MGSKQRVVEGVIWSVLVNVVNAIYGFVATPLLISLFGKDEYGLIALAMSINSYMALMDLGLNSTNVRFFSKWLASGNTEKVKKLMQTCTAFYAVIGFLNAILLLVIYIFCDSIFKLTPDQSLILKQLLLVLSAMAIINWYTSCFSQLISATENIAWIQKRILLTKFLMIIVLLLTFILNLSVVAYFIGTQVVTLMVLPLTIKKILKDTPFVSLTAKFDWATFREILPYSLSIFSFAFFQFSFYNLRAVFLGIQGGASDVAEFNVMNSLVHLATTVSSVFLGALLPSSTRIVVKGDKENYYRLAYQGTKFITITLCFASLGMLTVSGDLMMIYVGESYMHLIPWLGLWLVLVVFSNHIQCISSLILAGSDVSAISRITMISSILGMITTWLTIPYYGAGGAILGNVVYSSFMVLFYWLYYYPQKMAINSCVVVFRSFLPFVLIGAFICATLHQIPHLENHWFNVILFGSIFAILYIICVWFVLDNTDKKFVLGIIAKKR